MCLLVFFLKVLDPGTKNKEQEKITLQLIPIPLSQHRKSKTV
jgi:hypothetical protein